MLNYQIEKKHGDIKVKGGQKQNYLGMNLDFDCNGNLKISMIQYMEEINKNLSRGSDTSKTAKSSANHLFQVRNIKEAKFFLKKKPYHSITLLHSCYF